MFDKADAAPAFAMARELRAAGIRAEAYVGTGKFGDQFKYADKRGAAIAVIEGGDERAQGRSDAEGSGARRRAGEIGRKPRRLGRRSPGADDREARAIWSKKCARCSRAEPDHGRFPVYDTRRSRR